MPFKDKQKAKEYHKIYSKKYAKLYPERLQIADKKYKESNPKKIRETQHRYYLRNKKDRIENSSKWKREHKEYMTKYSFKKNIFRKYGITVDDYNKMYSEQSGVCKICGLENKSKGITKEYKLVIDHNHKTGKLRGLLCTTCNSGLGMFKEDIKLLEKVINYITIYNSCPADTPADTSELVG